MGGTYPTPRAAQGAAKALSLGFPSGALGSLPPLPPIPSPGAAGKALLKLAGRAAPGLGTAIVVWELGNLAYQLVYHANVPGTGVWSHPRYAINTVCRAPTYYLASTTSCLAATCFTAVSIAGSGAIAWPPPGTINSTAIGVLNSTVNCFGTATSYPSGHYTRTQSGTSGSWTQNTGVRRVWPMPMRSVSTSRDPLTGKFPWQGALPLPWPVGPATARRPALANPGEWSHGGYNPPWIVGGIPVPGAPGIPWNPPGVVDPAVPGVIRPPVVVPRPVDPTKPVVPAIPSTRFVVTPGARTATRPSGYRPSKPKAGTKELKLWARTKWQQVARLVNAPTEACDFINAMHKAITASDTKGFTRSAGLLGGSAVKGVKGTGPATGMLVDRQMQRKLFERRGYRPATCTDKLVELYDYADHVNVSAFMENLLINQVTDFIFGKIGSVGGKASARLGARSGRLAGIETGPLH